MLDTLSGQLTILNEPTYSFRSVDNLRRYDTEVILGEERGSVHGVRARTWSAVFASGGGRSEVHEHSAVEVNGRLYLAVGNHVICLDIFTGVVEWSLCVDWATCFGVYWDVSHEALISHGELQISRLSLEGAKIWAATGEDIFTQGFRCLQNGIEVIDFNGRGYLFDYVTGRPFCRLERFWFKLAHTLRLWSSP